MSAFHLFLPRSSPSAACNKTRVYGTIRPKLQAKSAIFVQPASATARRPLDSHILKPPAHTLQNALPTTRYALPQRITQTRQPWINDDPCPDPNVAHRRPLQNAITRKLLISLNIFNNTHMAHIFHLHRSTHRSAAKAPSFAVRFVMQKLDFQILIVIIVIFSFGWLLPNMTSF